MRGNNKKTVRAALTSVVSAAVLGGTLTGGALAGPGVAAATPMTPESEAITDVVIVPGQYLGSLPYELLAHQLRESGYRTHVMNLPGTDVLGEPARIGQKVDGIHSADPKANVAIVGHSIGAVTARWYLKQQDGHEKVATYISIGAPQYGSAGACAPGRDAPQVCPGSDYLAELNSGDDTPGDTFYVGIRNEREWTDGHLDGGQCRATPVPGFAPLPDVGAEHTLETVDPRVAQQVQSALRGSCDGEFVDEADGTISYESSEFPNGEPDWNPA